MMRKKPRKKREKRMGTALEEIYGDGATTLFAEKRRIERKKRWRKLLGFFRRKKK